MSSYVEDVHEAADYIRQNGAETIDIAVILGTGLGHLADQLFSGGAETATSIPYADIPGKHSSTLPFHDGKLIIGDVNGLRVALCQGRIHLYEGYTAREICLLTYVLSQLGARSLIITNAAGALNPDFNPGDVMLIRDHINLTGHNPVVGQNDDLGSRFTDMSDAYSKDLAALVKQAGQQQGVREGVYAGVLGPTLETSAERRMIRSFGADAVGMSTVLEVIAANQTGMQVLGLSAITNMALGDEHQQADTVEEILHQAEIAGRKIAVLIRAILESKPR